MAMAGTVIANPMPKIQPQTYERGSSAELPRPPGCGNCSTLIAKNAVMNDKGRKITVTVYMLGMSIVGGCIIAEAH